MLFLKRSAKKMEARGHCTNEDKKQSRVSITEELQNWNQQNKAAGSGSLSLANSLQIQHKHDPHYDSADTPFGQTQDCTIATGPISAFDFAALICISMLAFYVHFKIP